MRSKSTLLVLIDLRQQQYNAPTENLVYLFTCKTCCEKCAGSTKYFQPSFKSCKFAESFKTHFADVNKKDENDCEGMLIYQGDHVKKFVKTKSFCQHEVYLMLHLNIYLNIRHYSALYSLIDITPK